CEFVHRLLRDYFALRVLRPRLSVPDKQRRLDAIRFLGYQGEASLDVLTEFATDEDPEVRAAALTGLSHVSSPIVAQCLAQHLDDPPPVVRKALLPAIFTLSISERDRLLSSLKPLGDGCELDPLLDDLRKQVYLSSESQKFIRDLAQAEVEVLKARLKSKDSAYRSAALGVLSHILDDTERRLLSRDVDGVWPWLDPVKPISR